MSTNRAEIVDVNFVARVRDGRLPLPTVSLTLAAAGLTPVAACDLFETQVMSRHLDFSARLLKARSESFYTIGSAGHEGNAVLGMTFHRSDMAFLHYRSGALFVQRQKQLAGSTPIWDMLLSLAASAEDKISGGRHKVFGSLPLLVPPQTSTIASHLPKAVGMALSIRRAKDLGIASTVPEGSIVLCNFGDASANHASALSAFNAASWAAYQGVPVPIVFVCEDNGIGISVSTPGGWVQAVAENRPMLQYTQCDGRHLADAYRGAAAAVAFTRRTGQPSFLHMRTVRLLGHAGSDVEGQYHSSQRIEAAEADDPLLHSAALLLEEGALCREDILNLYEAIRQRVARAAEHAILRPKLLTVSEVMSSVLPNRTRAQIPPLPSQPSLEAREGIFASEWRYLDKPQHLAKLINWALVDILLRYQNTLVFGEDVAQKGGVYNVTTGLYQRFGARRVFNSLLDETSILGTAIGMAHNGFIPIPEIQFLAYVHNAEDQLRGEAATLSFFSAGRFTNPMVVRIAGLAYQKGFGGHFHNDNSLAVFRDLPGVIIACPSNGADAAMMLRSAVRAAHEQGRVVIFIEPIALYMTKDLHVPGDGGWLFPYPAPDQEIPIGQFGVHGDSTELAVITYGNGTYLARQAAAILAKDHDLPVKIIDLRWLAPLDEAAIAAAVGSCKAVLIVDECRRTGSQSEALMTMLIERLEVPPRLRRLTAEDCFIPLGRAATVTLPSKESIIAAALSLSKKAPSKRKRREAST